MFYIISLMAFVISSFHLSDGWVYVFVFTMFLIMNTFLIFRRLYCKVTNRSIPGLKYKLSTPLRRASFILEGIAIVGASCILFTQYCYEAREEQIDTLMVRLEGMSEFEDVVDTLDGVCYFVPKISVTLLNHSMDFIELAEEISITLSDMVAAEEAGNPYSPEEVQILVDEYTSKYESNQDELSNFKDVKLLTTSIIVVASLRLISSILLFLQARKDVKKEVAEKATSTT